MEKENEPGPTIEESSGQRQRKKGKEREREAYLHNRPDSQKSMISWPDKDDHL